MRHVASRVYVDEEANAGDDKNHHSGQLIELEPKIGSKGSCLDPAEVVEAELMHLLNRGLEKLCESQ